MIRLVCFDVDGTLVDDTVFIWQTLHGHFRTSPETRKRLADDYFSGKTTYAEWAGAEVKEWISKGADRKSLLEAVSRLRLIPGVREALAELKRKGIRLAIVSGSLDFVIEAVMPDYMEYFDEEDILINRLHFDSKGRIANAIFTDFDMEKKADGLKHLAKKHRLKLSECAFVGDNHNDIAIAREAGLSISFNSKSKELDEVCDIIIQKKDLREILHSFLR